MFSIPLRFSGLCFCSQSGCLFWSRPPLVRSGTWKGNSHSGSTAERYCTVAHDQNAGKMLYVTYSFAHLKCMIGYANLWFVFGRYCHYSFSLYHLKLQEYPFYWPLWFMIFFWMYNLYKEHFTVIFLIMLLGNPEILWTQDWNTLGRALVHHTHTSYFISQHVFGRKPKNIKRTHTDLERICEPPHLDSDASHGFPQGPSNCKWVIR